MAYEKPKRVKGERESFGSVFSVGAFGDYTPGSEVQVVDYDCYEIKKCEMMIYIKKDPLTSETNFIGIGEASLECCCLNTNFAWPVDPYGNAYFDPMNAEPGVTEGSVEEGRLRWFVSVATKCCRCATVKTEYPGAPREIFLNKNCICEKEDLAQDTENFRVTGSWTFPSPDATLEAAVRLAESKLGHCKPCGGGV